MKRYQGLGRVFAFTLRRQISGGGFRALTASVAALCFLVPALVLGIMAVRAEPEMPELLTDEPYMSYLCSAEGVVVTDETADPITDWSFLADYHPYGWNEVRYTDTADAATLLMTLRREEGCYTAHVSLPEGSALTEEDVMAYESFLWDVFPLILQVKSGLTPQQLAAITAPIEVGTIELTGDDGLSGVREVLGMLLPYLCVMVMYFLVLFYGQGVANSVVLEKTSKLMDFFLVTVEPTAMVLGKVLAMATAALLQLGAWLVSLTAGFAVGAMLCRSLAPDAQFGILAFFDSLTWLEGMFSLSAVLLSVGIMVGGFLLYCALAGVGGAMAGKAEDLSNTNVLFSLTLVASFLICLLSGGGEGVISEAAWLGFVPFTAILVAPARLLLGQMSPLMGAVSCAIVLATAAALCLLAGRVYRMMSLYKGDPPTPQKLIAMLRENK